MTGPSNRLVPAPTSTASSGRNPLAIAIRPYGHVPSLPLPDRWIPCFLAAVRNTILGVPLPVAGTAAYQEWGRDRLIFASGASMWHSMFGDKAMSRSLATLLLVSAATLTAQVQATRVPGGASAGSA